MWTAEELKGRIDSAEVKNGRRVFAPEVRLGALEYTGRQVQLGGKVSRVARELGLAECTLARWRQVESKRAAPAQRGQGFVELSVAMPKSQRDAAHFTVRCPSGYEVSVPAGFEAASLKQLLHALEGV